MLLGIAGNWWWPLSKRKCMAGDRTWWSGFQKSHLSCTNEFILCSDQRTSRQQVHLVLSMENIHVAPFSGKSTQKPKESQLQRWSRVSWLKEQPLGSSVGGRGEEGEHSVCRAPLQQPCHRLAATLPAQLGTPPSQTTLLWQQTWANYMREVHFNHNPRSHRDITCDASSQ